MGVEPGDAQRRVDRAAGTIRVRALLPNRNQLFAPGLFARVRLADSERRSVALVQDQSVGTDQDRKFVLVLKPDNTVEYRAITIGRMVDGLRMVQSGLGGVRGSDGCERSTRARRRSRCRARSRVRCR